MYRSFPRQRGGRWLVAGAALLALSGCGRASAAGGDTRLLHVLLAERFTTGRVSGGDAWHACAVIDSLGVVPRMVCGQPLAFGTRRARRITAAARGAPRSDANVAALRGQALLELRWADSSRARVDGAVAKLERAARLAPADAAVLNDLSVVYLAQAEHDQALAPMLRALDAADRALALDSLLAPALFNRALVLERLYLVEGARAAWARYRAVERSPRWRDEAGAHLRRLSAVAAAVSWDSLIATPPTALDARARAAVATRVARSPQAAREAEFPLLRAWGLAELSGDSGRAARLLSLARAMAGAMETMDGVDRSLPLAVRAIDAAPTRSRVLARGHVLLGAGVRLFLHDSASQAADSLAAAERALAGAGSPAARWAAFYRGGTEVSMRHDARADALLRRVLGGVRPDEPALLGKTWWALGLNQLRRGNLDTATALYRRAEPFITRSREAQNQGAVALLQAEALILAGQVPGETEAYRALRLLSPYPASNFLNNHLAVVAAFARSRGLPYAALDVSDEMVGVARRVRKPAVVALALCTRAGDRDAAGRSAAAAADVREAERWARTIGADPAKRRMRANVTLACGRLERLRDPRAALPRLDSAVQTYSAGGERDLYLPTALYEAAQAAAATGDTARARAWLRDAVKHVEGQQAAFTHLEVRATFYETVESLFDAMVAMELAEGRPASAFEYLERSRIATGSRRATREHAATLEAVRASLPAGMLLIEYALLDREVVIWTVSRRGWRTHRVAVGRDSVAALVERFAREAGAPPEGASSAAARLHALLLAPATDELQGMHRLIVVPDRELGSLPFAALRDGAGRYVVEGYEVRTVPSAAFYLAAASRAPRLSAGAAALVVGDPMLDPVSERGLPDLPGARREAEAVAALYRGAAPLSGAAASRGAVLRLLAGASIFHFAGHAVMNREEPEQSYLALAPDGPGGGAILTAREIGGLRLSNVRVVVLSACSSLTPRASHTGAAAGLAYSFLRAGSPATVSTLWDVDDAATTELLVDFHRRLSAGTPAAEALRRAQVDALRAPGGEARAPQNWAAFIYTGP